MKRLVLLTFLFSTYTFASGNRVGNGGNVVTCADKTELLDFVESNLPLMTAKPEHSYKEIIAEVLTNLKRLSPLQAEQYTRRAALFADDTEFKTGISLVSVPDSKHVFKPEDKNCEVRQIAIRRNEASVVTKRFVIDEKLWKKLSERDKAGLVLHEIIYEHLFKLGEEDSVKARAINAYIFSDKAFQEGPETYWKMIKDFKLPIYR